MTRTGIRLLLFLLLLHYTQSLPTALPVGPTSTDITDEVLSLFEGNTTDPTDNATGNKTRADQNSATVNETVSAKLSYEDESDLWGNATSSPSAGNELNPTSLQELKNISDAHNLTTLQEVQTELDLEGNVTVDSYNMTDLITELLRVDRENETTATFLITSNDTSAENQTDTAAIQTVEPTGRSAVINDEVFSFFTDNATDSTYNSTGTMTEEDLAILTVDEWGGLNKSLSYEDESDIWGNATSSPLAGNELNLTSLQALKNSSDAYNLTTLPGAETEHDLEGNVTLDSYNMTDLITELLRADRENETTATLLNTSNDTSAENQTDTAGPQAVNVTSLSAVINDEVFSFFTDNAADSTYNSTGNMTSDELPISTADEWGEFNESLPYEDESDLWSNATASPELGNELNITDLFSLDAESRNYSRQTSTGSNDTELTITGTSDNYNTTELIAELLGNDWENSTSATVSNSSNATNTTNTIAGLPIVSLNSTDDINATFIDDFIKTVNPTSSPEDNSTFLWQHQLNIGNWSSTVFTDYNATDFIAEINNADNSAGISDFNVTSNLFLDWEKEKNTNVSDPGNSTLLNITGVYDTVQLMEDLEDVDNSTASNATMHGAVAVHSKGNEDASTHKEEYTTETTENIVVLPEKKSRDSWPDNPYLDFPLMAMEADYYDSPDLQWENEPNVMWANESDDATSLVLEDSTVTDDDNDSLPEKETLTEIQSDSNADVSSTATTKADGTATTKNSANEGIGEGTPTEMAAHSGYGTSTVLGIVGALGFLFLAIALLRYFCRRNRSRQSI